MTHPKIDYVEFSSPALGASRDFFAKAFGWSFQDYGPTYAAMTNAGVDGGIQGDAAEANTAPLVILKADDLEAVETAVKAAGAWAYGSHLGRGRSNWDGLGFCQIQAGDTQTGDAGTSCC